MKIKAYKNYIDKLGNISETKAIFNQNGQKDKKHLLLLHIDNINNPIKKPLLGKKEFKFGYNGKLHSVSDSSPYNPIKRFYFWDFAFLHIKRFFKKYICAKKHKN